MCGISGVITKNKQQALDVLNCAEKIQKHRGPDIQDHEVISLNEWELGLGHQRLSILDLSDDGKQPMMSASQKSVIVYNGEVYNYKELSEDVLRYTPRTGTDTEIVLEVLERDGIEAALNQFNGMWAFAWFDHVHQKLYLARDRVGVKPLYYYLDGESLIFSSEVKTILEAVNGKFTLDHQAVGEYLLQSLQDTSNNSFYSEIHAVPAGHFLEIDLSKPVLELKFSRYWNVLEADSYTGDDLVNHTKELFNDAVRLRMRSDVPVGVTLSGGLDSSAIASSMKEHLGCSDNLNILSVVSPGSKLDESEFIDEMADYLGAKIHKIELNWSASEAVELLQKVTWYNDSPVGSFSNVAHFLMMKKAYELGITVILSGQGADELLCGYKKYLGFYLQELIRKTKFFKALKVLSGFVINRSIVNQFSFLEAKRYLPKRFQRADIDVRGPKLKAHFQHKKTGLKLGQTMQQRQAEDLDAFSVPFLTHYEDRMSMAWSREIRLPFLDYRLMELFVNLPTSKKLTLGWTKYILRQAMSSMLPKKINWRKDKQGFINPQEDWLKKELKPVVLSTFSENALIFKCGLVDREALILKYEAFCSQSTVNGKVWYRDIFAPFALEVWLQLNKKYLILD
jgi:asparagine synthase (glutamine-hydrolysing)